MSYGRGTRWGWWGGWAAALALAALLGWWAWAALAPYDLEDRPRIVVREPLIPLPQDPVAYVIPDDEGEGALRDAEGDRRIDPDAADADSSVVRVPDEPDDGAVPEGMQAVCGADPIPKRQRGERPWPSADEIPGLGDGLRRIAAALAGGDAQSQAAGQILSYEAFRVERSLPAGCARDDPACRQNRLAAREFDRQTMGGLAQSLYVLAQGSQDLTVWSLARHYCDRLRDPMAACTGLDFRIWAAREPRNGWPWLWIADGAHKVRDTVTMEQALFQLGHADTVDPHTAELALVLERDEFDPRHGMAGIVATYLLAEVIGQVRSPWGALNVQCRGKALEDANRRALCDGAARTLAAKSELSSGVVLGTSVGRHLGWSREERSAYMAYLRKGARMRGLLARQARTAPLSCRSAQSVRQLLLGRARLGERGYAERSADEAQADAAPDDTGNGRDAGSR